jgi:hypothetical protein
MWEIGEGDSMFLYAMKLVPPKDIVHLKMLFIATIFNESIALSIPTLFIDKHVFAYRFYITLQTP